MHIPNGFIPLWQCAIYFVILIVALYFSQKWARKNLDEKSVPLMAVLAAGIFAIMSMNIPIAFGTSGHMVGRSISCTCILCSRSSSYNIYISTTCFRLYSSETVE